MTEKIYVIKQNGSRQLYDPSKLIASVFGAGVPQPLVGKVIKAVEAQMYDNIPTAKLYQLVWSEIDNLDQELPSKLYRIRELLAQTDSEVFEKIISDIFVWKGYRCHWNVIVPGFCTTHQIDIIVEKNQEKFLVEVKRHKGFHRDTGLGDVVEMWGRLLDINQRLRQEKKLEYKGAILVTNTKYSDHARQFSQCRNLGLLGWRWNTIDLNSPKDRGLEKIIIDIGQRKIIDLINKKQHVQK